MSGSDPRDPFWMPVPFDDWPDEPQPIRVGVTTENYGHPMHPQVLALVEKAADYLSDAGYAVERLTTPSVDEAADCWFRYPVMNSRPTSCPMHKNTEAKPSKKSSNGTSKWERSPMRKPIGTESRIEPP